MPSTANRYRAVVETPRGAFQVMPRRTRRSHATTFTSIAAAVRAMDREATKAFHKGVDEDWRGRVIIVGAPSNAPAVFNVALL